MRIAIRLTTMTTVTAMMLGSALALTVVSNPAAGQGAACGDLPSHGDLSQALEDSVQPSGGPDNGGFNLNMWGTVVNRDGIVCAVTFTGEDRGDQWPGSRVISAQKANTANAFSLPGLALSTANLWTAAQPGGSTFVGDPGMPGGSLFGLQHSNPVSTDVAYKGPARNFGSPNDPMVGEPIGGVNVFGGGLALYDESGDLLGAVGVSGDSSCADHNVAWRVRDTLGLDFVPGGVNPDTGDDNIIYDVVDTTNGNAVSESGFGHPQCDANDAEQNEDIVGVCPTGGTSENCLDDVLNQ